MINKTRLTASLSVIGLFSGEDRNMFFLFHAIVDFHPLMFVSVIAMVTCKAVVKRL